MKPSGLGWGPEVPAHWDVAKICLLARLESGHTPSRQHPEYWLADECTIPWFSLADIWQLRPGIQEYVADTAEKISPLGAANSAARLLPAGTVVLSRTASVGFAGIMAKAMATTQDFANWVPGERVSSEYLLYALRAMSDEFERVRYGSTHNTIYMPDIRRLAIPVPSREEQRRIVAFLRARLPKVDELIAKKERLAALLAEKGQALITQLVTKGLDPNAAMRESGSATLGDVPAGWHALPLRRLRDGGLEYGANEAAESLESTWPRFIRITDIDDAGRLRPETFRSLPPDVADPYLLRDGDILLARSGATVGKAFIYRSEMGRCCFAGYLIRLRVDRARMLPDYVRYYTQAAPYLREVRSATIQATIQNVSAERYGAFVVPVPPLHEQRVIVQSLDTARQKFARAEQLIEDQLARLREYRQALITAAVTGQLDVGDERAVAVHDQQVAEAT